VRTRRSLFGRGVLSGEDHGEKAVEEEKKHANAPKKKGASNQARYQATTINRAKRVINCNCKAKETRKNTTAEKVSTSSITEKRCRGSVDDKKKLPQGEEKEAITEESSKRGTLKEPKLFIVNKAISRGGDYRDQGKKKPQSEIDCALKQGIKHERTYGRFPPPGRQRKKSLRGKRRRQKKKKVVESS